MLSLQDLQYENASLKAKLAELYAAQKCDKEAFDRKLGWETLAYNDSFYARKQLLF